MLNIRLTELLKYLEEKELSFSFDYSYPLDPPKISSSNEYWEDDLMEIMFDYVQTSGNVCCGDYVVTNQKNSLRIVSVGKQTVCWDHISVTDSAISAESIAQIESALYLNYLDEKSECYKCFDLQVSKGDMGYSFQASIFVDEIEVVINDSEMSKDLKQMMMSSIIGPNDDGTENYHFTLNIDNRDGYINGCFSEFFPESITISDDE